MGKKKRPGSINDLVNSSYVTPVSIEQIRAIVKFLPIFENLKPKDLACMVDGHLQYHEAVYEFMAACHANGFVQRTFNWPAWAKRGERYIDDNILVAKTKLTTCVKLIMESVRYERFCDGHLEFVIKSGHISAVLRRLKQFASAPHT